jgi:hypothetical protein
MRSSYGKVFQAMYSGSMYGAGLMPSYWGLCVKYILPRKNPQFVHLYRHVVQIAYILHFVLDSNQPIW